MEIVGPMLFVQTFGSTRERRASALILLKFHAGDPSVWITTMSCEYEREGTRMLCDGSTETSNICSSSRSFNEDKQSFVLGVDGTQLTNNCFVVNFQADVLCLLFRIGSDIKFGSGRLVPLYKWRGSEGESGDEIVRR